MFNALLRTLVYADLFDYALTAEEVWRYSIREKSTAVEVKTALTSAVRMGVVLQQDELFALPGRAELFGVRLEREGFSSGLWPQAQQWGRVLAALPFVRLVAVTGALAMRNSASPRDDVDYLIVTVPGRVWLARALCVGVVHLARRFGVELCPNYVLSNSALAQSPRNLYIAHELAQMVPLSGFSVYQQMQAANRWVGGFLPNHPFARSTPPLPPERPTYLQRAGEFLLPPPVATPLENWEQRRKQGKFQQAAAHASAAQLDADRVKGHFNDHGAWVLAEYEARIEALLVYADSSKRLVNCFEPSTIIAND